MAEIILSTIAKEIIGSLGSVGIQEIGLLWGVNDELEQLQDTVSAINAVLLDAETKQNHNHQVKFWLQRLQEVVLAADDLVDDISTEALRKSLMPGNSNMVKQVCTFFPSSNQLLFRHKMGHKIKNVKKKLAAIANDRIQLNLEESHGEAKVVNRLRDHTHSFVSEKEVIGRDDDRIAILQLLLDTKTKENLFIIPIVGIGGLGKTTLAQLVFNDKQVQKHFDLKLWVCVSDHFDVKLLVEKIIRVANVELKKDKEMEQLQQILREKINGKRYLLVLDDVWNEDHIKWYNLKSLLLNGVEGSKIIITTRSKVVARITGTMPAYRLKVMDKKKSWALFKKIALEQGQESNMSSNVLEIGMHIVDKCGGIPLAIRTIGGVLRLKNPETEWSSFIEKELSKIPQTEDDIIPTLKLSYDHLPSNLKQCFVYLSLFPKDYVINVEVLVQHWMAQGLIKISDPTDCLEDMGYEYARELLWRSFFEEVELDDKGNVTKCKMHDLMHDFAESITRPEFDMRNGKTRPIDSKTRHVSLYQCGFDLLQIIQPSLIQAKKMRTILRTDVVGGRSYTSSGSEATCDAIASNLKLLRMLDLNCLDIMEVPNSIGKLKHLRYLDLSRNGFKALPDCITRLHNLQTLKLNGCDHLQVLPKDINKLINLRNLENDGCGSLKYMPCGLGELGSLCKLSKFTLSEDMGSFSDEQQGGGLDELSRLNNLRGKLRIENLGRLDAMVQQPKEANLKEKLHLRSLDLRWIVVELDKITEAVAECYEMQLEGLQPHPNLKDLYVGCYQGIRFPSWFDLLTGLERLDLCECYKCQHLPPLHRFPSLKQLSLKNLHALEYVSNDDLSCSSLSSTSTFFPSLKKLFLFGLSNLKGWWRKSPDDNSFATARTGHNMLPIFPSCLSELIIEDCPSLTCMPLFPYVSKRLELIESSWIPVQQTILNGGAAIPSTSSSSYYFYFSPLCKWRNLLIYKIDDLQFLPDELKSLTSLKNLQISHCQELKSLYPGIQHLTSLEHLEISHCQQLDMSTSDTGPQAAISTMWQPLQYCLLSLKFDRLPLLLDLPNGLQHLTSLQKLEIRDCENLVSLPEWIKSFKSLRLLRLSRCPKLASLPQEITSLTSLHTLEIQYCATLSPRCRSHKGEDWPKISHIPDLQLAIARSLY